MRGGLARWIGAAVLATGLAPAAHARIVMPPATAPNGEPLWLPGPRLPSRAREGRNTLGHLLMPVPPKVPPTMRYYSGKENYDATMPAAPYWRDFLPYYQFDLEWMGPRGGVSVGGPESPASIEWGGR